MLRHGVFLCGVRRKVLEFGCPLQDFGLVKGRGFRVVIFFFLEGTNLGFKGFLLNLFRKENETFFSWFQSTKPGRYASHLSNFCFFSSFFLLSLSNWVPWER